MPEISNPILPGFHPDPSLCRVGDDFYLVPSSFSFYPGLPVFHSRDLVHWEQLGHVIDRPDMLRLNSRRLSGGLWAPTIRWHNGLFYVICTHSEGGGDFACTAENPAGRIPRAACGAQPPAGRAAAPRSAYSFDDSPT